jgi:hypothetical protein
MQSSSRGHLTPVPGDPVAVPQDGGAAIASGRHGAFPAVARRTIQMFDSTWRAP